MVFISKEPELFGGNVKVALLLDGEEVRTSSCPPEEVDGKAIAAVDATIRSFTSYLLKNAPNVRHTDILQLRQSINQSKKPHQVIHKNIALIRKHQPGGKLQRACSEKLRHIEELIEFRQEMELAKTSKP